ncbi:M24 family metallopeptidase [Pseudogracilibacillus auburnensis]|uniref:Xaa-Pro dipeptidase n=1 Tax=Pseudogracilibacillus auburnensis TaxID=1494959 RepID=A0A2V3VFV6_9BACI|nr:Xaa-Pro peptidase family protein [Pseudogracilibacillus auburnensis]PXW80460.1 Xaa-Pro dipeptidase [Pseudogracilibacillus auburnensis]
MNTIYSIRRTALIEHLKEENICCAMISNPTNVFYYTGFNSDPHERFMALFINVQTNEEFLFVPALDKEAAEKAADISTIIPISDIEVPFEIVKKTIGDLTIRLGIEGKAISYNQYIDLKFYFPSLELTDIQPFINTQRMKKSKVEIAALTNALKIIEEVLAKGINKVKVGMTEVELVAELEFLMRKCGADAPSFSTIVLSGEKAALPHGTPGDRKIQNGDFLLIDFGVLKDGYCSDITRTFAINSFSERQKELYDIVLQANEAGIDAVKAGVPLKTFDLAARNVIEEQGYGTYFNNRIGHGLGIEVHEEPSVHGKNDTLATEGIVFTIEPGIYIPNDIGIRIEDTVYINEQGEVEVLSTFPKQLQII